MSTNTTVPGWRALPRGVWALGFVSMFMDVSSELVHGLLPVFLVTVLAAPTRVVGLLEGIAEATAMITKVFAGALSDALGRRKPLLVAGYGLAALTKPLFALANGVGLVFLARFVDRIGKGIRGAPRNALVADITPKDRYGAAYGLRQSCDSLGAALGPLLAVALMAATGGSFRTTFWFAVIPAAIAVAILVIFVDERRAPPRAERRLPLRRAELRALGAAYWRVVVLGALFTLARFSEAFLLLRGSDLGLEASFVPFVLLVMNVVYALGAYPAGSLSDRLGRRHLLVSGLLVLLVADVVLVVATGPVLVLCGAALWGLHLALSEGLLAALVADSARADLRGTAFGVFNLVTGVALLCASVLAGLVWDAVSPAATFVVGGAITAAALVGFLVLRSPRATPNVE